MVDTYEDYVAAVSDQIRWKRARAGLEEELYVHLLDQEESCLAEGMTLEQARAESVRQMGDPVDTGIRLDRIHRPKPQWGPMLLIGVILALGFLAHTTLRDYAQMQVYYSTPFYFELRWIVCALPGIGIMLAVYFLDYTIFARRPLLWFSAGLLGIVFSFFLSHSISGRRLEVQYALLFAPVLQALLVYAMRGRRWFGFWVCMVGTALLCNVALCTPSLLLTALCLGSGIVLLLGAVRRGWLDVSGKWAVLWCGLPVLVLGWAAFPLVSRRLAVAFDPSRDPLGAGYHACVTRAVLRGAKWIGQGTVEGMGGGDALELLPAINCDSLLTWVIHRSGWLPGVTIVAALTLLMVWMFSKAVRQRGILAFLLSTAAVISLAVQVVSFVVFNLGFTLIGPISLPLISYGRWAMLANLTLVGLVLSVFREERLPLQESGSAERWDGEKRDPLIFWRDGDLVIGLSRFRQAEQE